MIHIADNHDALLDYLYKEGDPAERLTIAKHLQECAACAVAVLEFQNVRGMLHDWTPPASPSLNAPVTSPSASPISPSVTLAQGARGGWWRGWGPATTKERSWGWGPTTTRGIVQAAAAMLIFASGMAVSQLNIDYRDGAVIVSRRTDAPAPSSANVRTTSIPLPPQGASPVPDINLDEIERLLRARLETQSTPSADTERLFQRVRNMIDQSEQRQQRELALRLSQVAREVDAQHQTDVERIRQDFGQREEATMDYLVRTSGGVK